MPGDEWTLTVREAIRRVFREKGELHADDLAELGVPAEQQTIIDEQIARLVNAGYIVAVGRRRGDYELTEAGRTKLAQISAAGVE